MALYADSNGFYSVEKAIRVGQLLEEYKYGFFEEPVTSTGTKKPSRWPMRSMIPIAGGEQEYSLHGFRWLVANDGLQIVQPDNYYFGGMIRSYAGRADGPRVREEVHAPHVGRRTRIPLHDTLRFRTTQCEPHHEFKGLSTMSTLSARHRR